MVRLLRNQVNVVVNTGGVQALGGNMSRRTIILSGPKTNRVSVSFTGPGGFPAGLIMNPGTTWYRLDLEDMSEAFTDPIWLVAEAGSEQIGLIEVFG